MKAIELDLQSREEVGTSASRRLRRAGYVPAVIYSGGQSATNLKVDKLVFARQIKGATRAQLYTIKSNVKELDGELALIKDIEIDPLRQEVRHVDILHITAGVKITVTVPVEIEGIPADVKSAVATVEQQAHELELECLPREIPEKIVVQIDTLSMGDTIHAGDITLPEGSVLKSKKEMMIVSLVGKRADKAAGEEVAEAAAEPEKKAS